MFALEAFAEKLRTARVVVRGLALLRDLGPYAMIELLLPGGSLIALALWMYSRHKAGKPLLPFRYAKALSAARRLRALSSSAMRGMPSFNLLERRLTPADEPFDVRVAGMTLPRCSSCG